MVKCGKYIAIEDCYVIMEKVENNYSNKGGHTSGRS